MTAGSSHPERRGARLARETADHIVNVLMPGQDRLAEEPGVFITGDPGAERPHDA